MPSIRYLNEQNAWVDLGVNSFKGRTGDVMPQTGDYTASQVGAVPTNREVNGHSLDTDIELTAEDVNALSIRGVITASTKGFTNPEASFTFDDIAIPVGVYTLSAYKLGDKQIYGTFIQYPGQYHTQMLIISARGDDNVQIKSRRYILDSSSWTSWNNAVFEDRKINNKSLSEDITLVPEDIGAARLIKYEANILGGDANWIAEGDYFYQIVELNGISSDDNPTIGILTDDNNANNIEHKKNAANIFRIKTLDNSLQVWSTKKIQQTIPIQIQVVK